MGTVNFISVTRSPADSFRKVRSCLRCSSGFLTSPNLLSLHTQCRKPCKALAATVKVESLFPSSPIHQLLYSTARFAQRCCDHKKSVHISLPTYQLPGQREMGDYTHIYRGEQCIGIKRMQPAVTLNSTVNSWLPQGARYLAYATVTSTHSIPHAQQAP